MYFRIRTQLTDRPGSLAALATACGENDVNILGLQIFPDLGSVTDEVVVRTGEGWTSEHLTALVEDAGGRGILVERCDSQDLMDQPTRWLNAARDAAHDPGLIPHLLERLQGREESRWSATEHVRAAALRDIADLTKRRDPATSVEVVTYADTADGVVASIGGHTVGAASLGGVGPAAEASIEVAPAWRRLGIGTRLLHRTLDLARARGMQEVLLRAPADDGSLMPLLAAAGLRPLLKASGGIVTARMPLGARPAARRGEGVSVVRRD